jgi:hypothetical protein
VLEDRDLIECLENNPIDGLAADSIDRVLAVYKGYYKECSWHWIVVLNSNKIGYANRFGWVIGRHGDDWETSEADGGIADTLIGAMDAMIEGLGEAHANGDDQPSENELMRELTDQILNTKPAPWRDRILEYSDHARQSNPLT